MPAIVVTKPTKMSVRWWNRLAKRPAASEDSKMPTVAARSAGESMMLPLLHILSIWGPRLWRVADPEARDAVAVGAFNLMRRTTYEAVGGWERLRMEVIEDLRAEGDLKVSARRENNATTWFRVVANRSGTVRLRDNFEGREVTWDRQGVAKKGDRFEFQLKKGQAIEGRLPKPQSIPPKPERSAPNKTP